MQTYRARRLGHKETHTQTGVNWERKDEILQRNTNRRVSVIIKEIQSKPDTAQFPFNVTNGEPKARKPRQKYKPETTEKWINSGKATWQKV